MEALSPPCLPLPTLPLCSFPCQAPSRLWGISSHKAALPGKSGTNRSQRGEAACVGGGGWSSVESGKQWGRSGRVLKRCLAPWSGWSSRALQRASCLLNAAQGQRGQRGGLEHGQRRVSVPRPGCVRPLAATAQPGRASQDGTGMSVRRQIWGALHILEPSDGSQTHTEWSFSNCF